MKPDHYEQAGTDEPILLIRKLPKDMQAGFYLGNILKYTYRANYYFGDEKRVRIEINKAHQYTVWLYELYSEVNYGN